MNYNKIFTAIFLAFLCVSPVAANITYSDEYYKLGSYSDAIYNGVILPHYAYRAYSFVGTSEGLISAYELRRQTILLEKQNELQAELVKAQWVETCYAPFDNNAIGNRSAWSLECANAGYPVW